MKIISGLLKGRTITGFDIEGTRPTQDRVKESIFASIQDYIKDSTVLDLFAGTGNLGIEALSNYANYAYFVDNNKICIDLINKNLNNFKISNYKALNIDYKNALTYFKNNNIKFDLILLDPPYKDLVIEEIIDNILNNNLINDDGIIVCEAEFDTFDKNYDHLKLIKEKKYGYKFVKIYKKF